MTFYVFMQRLATNGASQEALPILKDQRELLKSLVEEKVASQKQYDLVLKRLDQLTVGNDESSISSLSKETTRTSNSSITLVNLSSSVPEAHARFDEASLISSLPGHLHHRAEEIFDHCRLINTVLEEVHHTQYKLDLGIRYRTQEMILDSHYNEWAHYVESDAGSHEDQDVQNLFSFLEKSPELVSLQPLMRNATKTDLIQKRHWARKHYHKMAVLHPSTGHAMQEQHQQMEARAQKQPHSQAQLMQAQAQRQAMAKQQMMQRQQMQQQMGLQGMQAPPTLQQQQRQQQQDQQGQQQRQHHHQISHVQQQSTRTEYDPRNPQVIAPTTPVQPTSFGSARQPIPVALSAQLGHKALQDSQMQMMLLEQQNKENLMMAHQEQEELSFGAPEATLATEKVAGKDFT